MRTQSLTPQDLELFHEGKMFNAYEYFGAHCVRENGLAGIRFTLWAPRAMAVNVVGDFNNWDGEQSPLIKVSSEGVWSGFVPLARPGEFYKYEIFTAWGEKFLKADPYAFKGELRPGTASLTYELSGYEWGDTQWLANRGDHYTKPINIYEVHLGSWKRRADGGYYTYRELAHLLVDYICRMGYTHLELMPIMEYPFDGSWGYQVTGFYAVTSRYGSPHDLMYLVDLCHQNGIGVILDWVPAHFCKDAHGLARFDGSPLFEGEEHQQWGTLQFDYSRPEVVCFLISNACFWFDMFHMDGLRVDAVASMLYLDYCREADQWKPNKYGGRENFEAVVWMKKLNETVFGQFPDVMLIAEESTSWPLVSRPTYDGGLGYNYKWNMGWMNDSLCYMQSDPLYRKYIHDLLTFSFMYAFSENFILPLSHDEVVHGKKSLIEKMPGDYWQKFANLRVFLGYLMAHPGKKLMFMGGEFAQFIEWRFYEELEWKLLEFPMHRNFQSFVRDLNIFYLQHKALWERDFSWEGFNWISCDNAGQSILVFQRQGQDTDSLLLIVCNFTPQYYENFRIGVPRKGRYLEVLNSDKEEYGGSGKLNVTTLTAKKIPWHNQAYSVNMEVAPLAVHFLELKD